MRHFVSNTLRQMLDGSYIILLCIYTLLGWFIVELTLQQGQMPGTEAVIALYNSVVFTLVLFTCIYLSITHFRESLTRSNRDILLLHLGNNRFFGGLLLAYAIFFCVFFTVPVYAVSVLQQYLSGVVHINYMQYTIALVQVIAISFPAIITAIALFIWIKNEIFALLVWMLLYSSAALIMLIISMIQTNTSSSLNILVKLGFYTLVNVGTMLIGWYLSKRLTRYEYAERIRGGVFAFISRKLHLPLSASHYGMIGLRTQNLYLIFGLAGLAFLLVQFLAANAQTIIIAKIYCAVLMPVLFSLNQYSTIRIDITSGMLPVLHLKPVTYRSILFNRWLCLLAPQLIITFLFALLLIRLHSAIAVSFIAYAILLSILFSSANFMMSVLLKNSGIANFIEGGIVYIMLREDVQNFFISSELLQKVNILSSVVSANTHQPESWHWIFAVLLIFISVLYTNKTLDNENLLANLANE